MAATSKAAKKISASSSSGNRVNNIYVAINSSRQSSSRLRTGLRLRLRAHAAGSALRTARARAAYAALA